jgi:hypothetical protein
MAKQFLLSVSYRAVFVTDMEKDVSFTESKTETKHARALSHIPYTYLGTVNFQLYLYLLY